MSSMVNVNNFFLCHSPGWKFINFVKQTVFFRAITVLHDIRPVTCITFIPEVILSIGNRILFFFEPDPKTIYS